LSTSDVISFLPLGSALQYIVKEVNSLVDAQMPQAKS